MALRERIESNPVLSVVSAAGAGFVAGMLVMLGIIQVIISDRGPRDRSVVQHPTEATHAPKRRIGMTGQSVKLPNPR